MQYNKTAGILLQCCCKAAVVLLQCRCKAATVQAQYYLRTAATLLQCCCNIAAVLQGVEQCAPTDWWPEGPPTRGGSGRNRGRGALKKEGSEVQLSTVKTLKNARLMLSKTTGFSDKLKFQGCGARFGEGTGGGA